MLTSSLAIIVDADDRPQSTPVPVISRFPKTAASLSEIQVSHLLLVAVYERGHSAVLN